MGFFPFTVLWVIYYIMLFAALLHCTSYNGNAIFSGNQSISFAQDSTVRAGLDGSRRVSRSCRTRRFAQVSTVRAGLDGSRRVSRSRRTRRFAQDSTVRAGLDGSRRTRLFSQDSTVRAGLDGSRRTRRFSQTELDGSRRTRRFAQDSTLLAATAPHNAYTDFKKQLHLAVLSIGSVKTLINTSGVVLSRCCYVRLDAITSFVSTFVTILFSHHRDICSR